jgi:hypothetical protein
MSARLLLLLLLLLFAVYRMLGSRSWFCSSRLALLLLLLLLFAVYRMLGSRSWFCSSRLALLLEIRCISHAESAGLRRNAASCKQDVYLSSAVLKQCEPAALYRASAQLT